MLLDSSLPHIEVGRAILWTLILGIKPKYDIKVPLQIANKADVLQCTSREFEATEQF